jgi:hypothetical protein
LNRDYDVINAQYQALIKSRETQSLSEKASDTDSTEFRVINPPLSDFEPVAPHRGLYNTGVLALGLALGAALCWFLAITRPVFSNAKSLHEIVGLPVLGVVSQAFGAERRMRRFAAVASFAGTMGGLAVLFVAIIALEISGRGLHTLLNQG